MANDEMMIMCKDRDRLRTELDAMRKEITKRDEADKLYMETVGASMQRALMILDAGNYDNLDHAAEKLVKARDDAVAKCAAMIETVQSVVECPYTEFEGVEAKNLLASLPARAKALLECVECLKPFAKFASTGREKARGLDDCLYSFNGPDGFAEIKYSDCVKADKALKGLDGETH